MDDPISPDALSALPPNTDVSEDQVNAANKKLNNKLLNAQYEQIRNMMRQLDQQTWMSKNQTRMALINAVDKMAQSVQI